MTDEVWKRLLDAFRAGKAIQDFVDAEDYRTYGRDLMLRSAVERQLEIFGEALGQAAEEDQTIEERIPSLPRIVALRNRVIHGYDSVDDEIVWDIVQSKVPPLIEDLRDFSKKESRPIEERSRAFSELSDSFRPDERLRLHVRSSPLILWVR